MIKEVDVSHFKDFDKHKKVLSFEDIKTGLKGFIAIHSDSLGPAVGGTRMFPYSNEEEAVSDVLRLSRSMSYKCALAGVPYGGGKAVIIGDPKKDKNKDYLRSYGRIINSIKGEFFTGEDVGLTEEDVQVMLQESECFIGRTGVAGDPSPFAALSTFITMKAAVSELTKDENLSNKVVGIKGVGKVGSELAKLIAESGGKIIISDINPEAIGSVKKNFPEAEVVAPEKIHSQEINIFSPCAMGGDLNESTANSIKAEIVCGGANNQLTSPEIDEKIFNKGIFYVPDYVANAGGLINVVDELEEGGYDRNRVLDRINALKHTVHDVFSISKEENRPSGNVADQLAESVFKRK